jgi:tetratricopeptide (TPR) repeat protein
VLAVSLAGSAAWLWDKVAPLAEGRRYLERAETLLALGVPPEVEARLHRQIGNLWHASDRPRALAALQRAEVLYRELNDRGNLGAVLALGGFLRSFLGASKTATQALQEARTILEATGRRKSLLNAMNNLGVLAAVEGDMQAARDLFEQALLITRTSGDRDTEIMVLVNLAEIEFNLDQIDAAVERAGSAVTQLRGAGRQTDLGWALTNLATYLLISGRLPEAARAAGEGLNLVRPAGGFILRVCLLQWALLAANAGQLAAAARLRGFVEAGYKQAGETLQPSEQRLSDRLNSLLEDGITAGQLAACFAEGAAWSEAEAAAFAASLGAASVGATRKYELPS